jgi:cell division protease FtsH
MKDSSWMRAWMGHKSARSSAKEQGTRECVSTNHKQKAATVNFWRLAASVLLIQGVVLGTPAQAQQTEQKTLKYGELLEKIDKDEVTRVQLDPGTRTAKVRLAGQKRSDPPLEVDLLDQNPELIEKLREKKVELDVEATTDTYFYSYCY